MKLKLINIAGQLKAVFTHSFVVLVLMAFALTAQGASAPLAESADTASQETVGQVSLVLGSAYLVKADSSRHPVEVGSEIGVNDQIVTEANGHVHIRFVDQALVSVRPGSQLEIIRYDYNESDPTQSSIKFNLVEGVTRSISGDGARSARQRFRLNTPIAAIGVRGTDFVVNATQHATRALVNEGAIVVAPYSSECVADAFGPCTTNALELTDNSLQMIELDVSEPSPRLVPATHERETEPVQADVRQALSRAAQDDDKSASAEVYVEVESASSVEVAEQALPSVDITPDAPIETPELVNSQLVWGRWSDGLGADERITTSVSEARNGRKITVANWDYGLYRVENQGFNRGVGAGLGPVSFSLDSAQAFYNADTGIVAMQVKGGSLDINFTQSAFNTSLQLDHAITGNVNFQASGSISDRGYFNARTATQTIAGAVSMDVSEAGYFFEKQLEAGSIQGLTLWDRR